MVFMLRVTLTLFFALIVAAASEGEASAQTRDAVIQLQFEEGLRHYDAGNHESALASFREVLELRSSPNARLYVARCLRELGRLAEAVSEYLLTAREAEELARQETRYDATQQAALQEMEALRSRIGSVIVSVEDAPEDMHLSVSGRDIPRQALALPLPVDPGEALIRAEAPGCTPAERRVSVDAGQTVEVHLSLEPDPDGDVALTTESSARRRSALMAATFSTIGLTVLSGAVTTALGVLTLRQNDEAWEICGDEPCTPQHFVLLDEGETYQLWTNITIGFTSAFAIASLVLALVTPWRSRNTSESTAWIPSPRGPGIWAFRW